MSIIETDSLTGALSALYGPGTAVAAMKVVPGGDINRAFRLELTGGAAVFMKSNRAGALDNFRAEARGLAALADTGTIGVPRPLALGRDGARDMAFLLLEQLDPAPRGNTFWEVFGHELAALHRADTAPFLPAGQGPYGFSGDNYIGATVQPNGPSARWADFFRRRRLAPQMERAAGYFDEAGRRRCRRLLDRLETLLPEPAFPSLLHGDLWSGNFVTGPDGKAWILDPAVYVGHCEVDLAMTELFGGFPPAFYGAYREVNPVDGGYRDRREIYDLYQLLNHLNLFGPSYLGSVERIIGRYS